MYLKKALKGTAVVFIFTVLAGISWYIFRMLLARSLSIQEYGAFYAVFAFLSFFSLFTDLGLSFAVPKFIVDLQVKNKLKDIKNLMLGILFFQLLVSIILISLILFSADFLSNSYFKAHSTTFLIIMGVWFITMPFASFIAQALIGFQKYGYSASVDFFRAASLIVLTSLFFFLGEGIYAPMLAYALNNILIFIVYSPIIKKKLNAVLATKFEFNKNVVFSAINYGFFISISSISWVFLNQMDTLLLTYFIGVSAVGLYQVALPLAGIALYLVNAMLLVAYPMSSELYARKKINELSTGITLFYKYMFFIILPIVIVLFSFADWAITLLFSIKYIDATWALRILAIGTIFSSYTLFNNGILSAIGQSRKAAKLMFIAVIINIILNVILINIYGIAGAATATATSFAIAFVISTSVLNKHIEFRIPIKKWIINIFTAGMTTILIFYLKHLLISWMLIPKILVMGVVAGLFYLGINLLFKVVNYKEVRYLVIDTIKK